MTAEVVDATGAVQGRDTIMLHHIGADQHDVTLVSGPVGFSAPWKVRVTFRHRFTRPGTYSLFCSLHPARMTQMVNVR